MRKLILALMIMAVCVAPATADTVKLVSLGLGQNISTNLGTQAAYQFNILLNNNPMIAYCTDLYSHINVGMTNTDVTIKSTNLLPTPADVNPPNANANSGPLAAWLFNTYQMGGGIDTNAKAAGLQAAIWEVLYDGPNDINIGLGNFRLTAPAADYYGIAASYLTALGSATSYGEAWWLDDDSASSTSTTGQDMITSVPEPGSMLLFGTGLVALARAARRRRHL